MTNLENFTNRELLQKAMPFVSLSRKEWNALAETVDKLSADNPKLHKICETLVTNQARIEVLGKYLFYYRETQDCPVTDESLEISIVS